MGRKTDELIESAIEGAVVGGAVAVLTGNPIAASAVKGAAVGAAVELAADVLEGGFDSALDAVGGLFDW